ncbi:MAG: 50S ribosomal protein L32 [Bacteroidota bacterium]
MAHPKSRISKQRKRKRRTHKVTTPPQVSICKKTGEPHLYHRAYWHEGNMYYKGQLVIEADVDLDE